MLDEMLASVRNLYGAYAECGVWRGETAQYIYERMDQNSELWLFDSFEGHAEPCAYDDLAAHPKGRYADTNVESVRTRCPDARIVPGWIPESLEAAKDVMFRFVRVDVDHYLPTKGIVEFFLPRMVAGGIMEFDDYNHSECPGATKAINEIIGAANVRMPAHWINA